MKGRSERASSRWVRLSSSLTLFPRVVSYQIAAIYQAVCCTTVAMSTYLKPQMLGVELCIVSSVFLCQDFITPKELSCLNNSTLIKKVAEFCYYWAQMKSGFFFKRKSLSIKNRETPFSAWCFATFLQECVQKNGLQCNLSQILTLNADDF